MIPSKPLSLLPMVKNLYQMKRIRLGDIKALSFLILMTFITFNSIAQETGSAAKETGSNKQEVVSEDQKTNKKIELFMEDGQLISHPVRVFVTTFIEESMEPQLELTCKNSLQKKYNKKGLAKVLRVAPDHILEISDTKHKKGTLIIFDLSKIPIPFYTSVIRFIPTLKWKEEGIAVGNSEIHLGNPSGAIFWTIVLFCLLIAFFAIVVKSYNKNRENREKNDKKSLINLLLGYNGHLSLWRTQVAAWTVAVGSLTFGFGLIYLKVPDIPDSLVILMGLSLTTGCISYLKGINQSSKSKINTGKVKWSFGDLICDIRKVEKEIKGEVVEKYEKLFFLPRAQMVIWTVLMLILFFVNSVKSGILWEVPWQMVALMGFSQAGYLAPKFKEG